MSANAIGEPVVDRPKVKVDGFDTAKCPLHHAQGFMGAHGGGAPDGFTQKPGALRLKARELGKRDSVSSDRGLTLWF